MLALTFYYLTFMVGQYEDLAYETIKTNRVMATSIFANNINGLVESGFTWDEHSELYDSMIEGYIETVIAYDFAYVAIVDAELQCVERFAGHNPCMGSVYLFEDENNLPIIQLAIAESNTGFVEIIINGHLQMLYFHAIPLDNIQYWIFIGVSRERVLEEFDFSSLRLPIFIIGFFFTISIMDSVWQRITKIRRE